MLKETDIGKAVENRHQLQAIRKQLQDIGEEMAAAHVGVAIDVLVEAVRVATFFPDRADRHEAFQDNKPLVS